MTTGMTGMKAIDHYGSEIIYCDSCIADNGDRRYLTIECHGQIINAADKGGRCIECQSMVGMPDLTDPRFLIAIAPVHRGGVSRIESALGFGACVLDSVKAASGSDIVLVVGEHDYAEWNSIRLWTCLLGGQVFESEAAARKEIAVRIPVF